MSDANAFSRFVYTGPGTVGGRYMRSFWQPVFVGDQIPAGRAKPLKIMNENYTIYRGQNGQAQVVAPYCPHRGTQLSNGWVEGDAIRCFYHGWKFGPHGQCVEAPAETERLVEVTKIRSYPTREYKGLIFAFLGDGEAPAFPEYSCLDGEGTIKASEYRRDCNYFNSVENQVDPVHVAFTHRASSFTDYGGLTGVPRVAAEETSWGIAMSATREDGGTRITQIGMPNMIHITAISETPGSNSWSNLFAWRVPIDDESHMAFSIWLNPDRGVPGAKVNKPAANARIASWTPNEIGAAFRRGELSHDDIEGHPAAIYIQDDVVQVGQGVIPNRAVERLGRSDVGIILLRRLWLRELQALEADAPMKSWQWSPSLAVANGTSVAAE